VQEVPLLGRARTASDVSPARLLWGNLMVFVFFLKKMLSRLFLTKSAGDEYQRYFLGPKNPHCPFVF
jgi:hypothetical protein